MFTVKNILQKTLSFKSKNEDNSFQQANPFKPTQVARKLSQDSFTDEEKLWPKPLNDDLASDVYSLQSDNLDFDDSFQLQEGSSMRIHVPSNVNTSMISRLSQKLTEPIYRHRPAQQATLLSPKSNISAQYLGSVLDFSF